MSTQSDDTQHYLARIAASLETLAGNAPPSDIIWSGSTRLYVWNAQDASIKPVEDGRAIPLDMLVGLDEHAKSLLQNTLQFAEGYSANNALLWGARGMGKSSLVKSVHAELSDHNALILIEILREDLPSLQTLLSLLNAHKEKRFILFCDDLAFEEEDASYKSLKAILEGGLQGRPDNVLFYATSNRRHLLPRNMIENENRIAIHGGEAVEEKVSLSDRFGLWLGFYPCEQDEFFAMITNYARTYKINISDQDLKAQAIEWSMIRGSRSGRVAWQFIQDIAGKHKIKL